MSQDVSDNIDHPRVRALVERSVCHCGTARGQGLMVRVTKDSPRHYRLLCRCLRCGYVGPFTIVTEDYAPGDLQEGAPAIGVDEVLDARSAMEEPDWWQTIVS